MFFSKKKEKKEKKPTVSVLTMVSFEFIHYSEYIGIDFSLLREEIFYLV